MGSTGPPIRKTARSCDFRPYQLFYQLRRVHEICLAILLLVLLDLDTTRLIRRVCRYLNGIRSDDEVVITLWFLTATVSFAAGVLMVYQHRGGKDFLPLRSLLTYVFIAGAWWVGLYGFIDEVVDLEMGTLYRIGGLFLCGWCLLSIFVPHLFWRRKYPTPLLFDAVLIMIVFMQLSLIVNDALGYGRAAAYWPMDWGGGYLILLIWTMLIWLLLGITRRRPRWLSYALVLMLNVFIYVFSFFVFLPIR